MNEEHTVVSDLNDEYTELKLYSPLVATWISDKIPFEKVVSFTGKEMTYCTEAYIWDDDLTEYKRIIWDALEKNPVPDADGRGLMVDFNGSPTVDKKVLSINVNAEAQQGSMYAVAVCRIKEKLQPAEIDQLKAFCVNQYVDGWGKDFRTRPLQIDGGTICLDFQGAEWYIGTSTEMGFIPEKEIVREINNDTFWTLMEQARAYGGFNLDISAEWIENQLTRMGPEQIINFDWIHTRYMQLSYKFGLEDAAAVIQGDYDAIGFMGFREWLILQGKEPFLNALKNPDSLADVEAYRHCSFDGTMDAIHNAYFARTGRDIYTSLNPPESCRDELKKAEQTIQYGEGINYPHKWQEMTQYLPRLCAKYCTPENLAEHIRNGQHWDVRREEAQTAHQNPALQKKNQQHHGGETR